jgi:hypothetical protein
MKGICADYHGRGLVRDAVKSSLVCAASLLPLVVLYRRRSSVQLVPRQRSCRIWIVE